MTMEVRPATSFDDVATMVGPKRPESNVCWCLSYRIPSKENVSLKGQKYWIGQSSPAAVPRPA